MWPILSSTRCPREWEQQVAVHARKCIFYLAKLDIVSTPSRQLHLYLHVEKLSSYVCPMELHHPFHDSSHYGSGGSSIGHKGHVPPSRVKSYIMLSATLCWACETNARLGSSLELGSQLRFLFRDP